MIGYLTAGGGRRPHWSSRPSLLCRPDAGGGGPRVSLRLTLRNRCPVRVERAKTGASRRLCPGSHSSCFPLCRAAAPLHCPLKRGQCRVAAAGREQAIPPDFVPLIWPVIQTSL